MSWLPKLLQVLSFYTVLAYGDVRVPVTETEFATKLKKYQTISHLKANFKQTKTFKDLSMKLKSEGTCEIQRPGKVTWKILKPSYVMVSMTEDEFQIVTGKDKDLKVQKIKLSEVNASQKKSMTELVAWLEMNPEKLYLQYEIYKIAENEFLFFPKQKKDNPFNSLTMKMDQKGNLAQLMIDETSGDSLKIDFEPPQVLKVN